MDSCNSDKDRKSVTVDLHTHSTASDGSLNPSDLLKFAKLKGLKAIALTDHDTIAGIEEAIKVSREVTIEFIPGVEISAQWDLGTMHILGFYIDHESKLLNETLVNLQQLRKDRNRKIISKLREHGVNITYDEVEQVANGQIGRLHISRFLVDKGYASNTNDAFKRFLTDGAPTYIPKVRLDPDKAIDLIIKSGGVPVLAHPCTLGLKTNNDLKDLLVELRKVGLQGVEAFYSEHSKELEEYCISIAKEIGLIITGGSDFHGKNKEHIDLGVGKGNLSVPYQLVSGLKKRREQMFGTREKPTSKPR